MSSSTKYIPTSADLNRLAARTPDDYRSMSSGESPSLEPRVYKSEKGLGFEYEGLGPYPTKGSAPARYSPGKGHPFGYEALERLERAEEKEKEKEEEEKKDDEEKGKRRGAGSYEGESDSTEIYRSPTPRAESPRGTGYRPVAAYDQISRDPLYTGSQTYGKQALAIFAAMDEIFGTPTGASHLQQYPRIFSLI